MSPATSVNLPGARPKGAPEDGPDTVPGPAPELVIDDVDVFIDGRGEQTLVMLHGWPDTPELWDATVASLADRFRCVRFHLPGFDLARGPRPASVDDICDLLRRIVDAVSPGQPVTLLLHDWGCVFGYEFAARHTDRVARIVGVDIGDIRSGDYLQSLGWREKAMIAGYQLWLAVAWVLGDKLPGLANRMTRWMARQIGCRNDPQLIGWEMNYPYAMMWFGAFGGLRSMARVDKLIGEKLPGLFVYGRRKPFMFHSGRWVRQLNRTTGCSAKALDTGHWVMKQKPAEFHAVLKDWLFGPGQPNPKA
ncbi:MAG: alpha/beta fold hydrolase [Hydrogenophaga sp.]|nr:alpha/beta fold hydrolase [Hydrogenophaga sp.]